MGRGPANPAGTDRLLTGLRKAAKGGDLTRSAALAGLALLLTSCLNQNTWQQTCYKIVESVVTQQGERYMVPAPCRPDYRGPVSG